MARRRVALLPVTDEFRHAVEHGTAFVALSEPVSIFCAALHKNQKNCILRTFVNAAEADKILDWNHAMKALALGRVQVRFALLGAIQLRGHLAGVR